MPDLLQVHLNRICFGVRHLQDPVSVWALTQTLPPLASRALSRSLTQHLLKEKALGAGPAPPQNHTD